MFTRLLGSVFMHCHRQQVALISFVLAGLGLMLTLTPSMVLAQAAPSQDTIAPGTTITMQNWQQYKAFMPDGMVKLFQGQFFWKLPQDLAIEIGPTRNIPLPAGYTQATEQYSSQVRVIHLPNGHYDIANYIAGQPFLHPYGPDKGYEVLANLWYFYKPHLNVATEANPIRFCTEDRFNNLSCLVTNLVYRQEDYNTDPDVPRTESSVPSTHIWFTEYLMVISPEESKYTAQLTLFNKNNQRLPDAYVFVPALRRSLRLSAAARCAPVFGTDLTQDDLHVTAFNGGIGVFQAKYIKRMKMIALTNLMQSSAYGAQWPRSAYPGLLFPSPTWGKWQLRDVDVIEVSRIPAENPGYCYGKRVMYIDRYYHVANWQDLYDSNMQLWKLLLGGTPDGARVPGVSGGMAPGLGGFLEIWDLQNDHMSVATSMHDAQYAYFVNSDAPKEYQNYTKYASPAGLMQIMQ